ncbi:MAG: HD domain-containing protein [Clostridia bacterium]|nr:HD domain-containing protein [Clostridia bacterium]MDD4047919.1 HD domain-containing protein [Clostridia bacterium]
MRAIDIDELKEGMCVARTIYDDAGRVLLSSGVGLNKLYIKKLNIFGIPFVYVKDEILGPLEVEDVINDRVRLQTVKALKNVVENARMQSDLDLKPVSGMINKILDDLKGVPDLLVQIMDPRSSNSYMYSHSVGVSVLSILTGMALHLDDLKLKILGMGSLLHDIGKSLGDGPEHTTYGFDILRNNKELNILIAHVAYQHHEKYDGTGYPRSLQGENINIYAAITSVADYYDQLVTNTDKSKRIYPYQALELILAESGRTFHPDVVKAFSRNIAPYPIGTAVRLNNGTIGVVAFVPRNYSTRPTIKVIKNHLGILQKNFPVLDLMEETTLFVNEIIKEQERREIIAR